MTRQHHGYLRWGTVRELREQLQSFDDDAWVFHEPGYDGDVDLVVGNPRSQAKKQELQELMDLVRTNAKAKQKAGKA
jgi:hypothetical protein